MNRYCCDSATLWRASKWFLVSMSLVPWMQQSRESFALGSCCRCCCYCCCHFLSCPAARLTWLVFRQTRADVMHNWPPAAQRLEQYICNGNGEEWFFISYLCTFFNSWHVDMCVVNQWRRSNSRGDTFLFLNPSMAIIAITIIIIFCGIWWMNIGRRRWGLRDSNRKQSSFNCANNTNVKAL